MISLPPSADAQLIAEQLLFLNLLVSVYLICKAGHYVTSVLSRRDPPRSRIVSSWPGLTVPNVGPLLESCMKKNLAVRAAAGVGLALASVGAFAQASGTTIDDTGIVASVTGVVTEIRVKKGDKIKVGAVVLVVQDGAGASAPATPAKPTAPK